MNVAKSDATKPEYPITNVVYDIAR